MLWYMPRRLHNWNYNQVIDFLKDNGFHFNKPLKGSHEVWAKKAENGEPDKRVEVNFTSDSYPGLTLKTMIRQSGIDQNEWIKWGGS